MRILIVDDVSNFVRFASEQLHEAGLDVSGIVAGMNMRTPDWKDLNDEAVLQLVNDADVIFLDHNMPQRNGEELLAYWQEKGVDLTEKRVVGISSGEQKYVKEHFEAGSLHNADRVKEFLGL